MDGRCLTCETSFAGADQDELMAAFAAHHDAEHPDATAAFSFVSPTADADAAAFERAVAASYGLNLNTTGAPT